MKCFTWMIGAAAVFSAATLFSTPAAWGAAPAAAATTPSTVTTLNGGFGSFWPDYYPDHASTVAGSYAYGLARVIRAEGQYNLDTSAAMLNFTEAQRREMENLQKWTETYFEMRRINREARAAERGKQPTEADLIRYAQIGKPKRLTPSDVDSITGEITWPLLLRAPEYAGYRAAVQQVFSHRASSGVIDLADYLKVFQLTSAMMDDLRERIRNLPPSDYVIARRFLESLAYEARLPVI